jgi:ankyrin repeat protein
MSRPLHRAALGGSLETVTWLVKEKKAMLNTCDDEEWRPLHFAASKVSFFILCLFLRVSDSSLGAH